jgi:hypothetical protein
MSLYSRAETDAQSLKVLNTTEKNSVDKYDHDNTLIVDGNSTVAGAQGYATAARRVIFIDQVEAGLAENKLRGLTSPGWWEYMTYTDASGKTRHKAQHLVAFASAPANTADADDPVGADVASSISIGTQPQNQSEVEGDPGAFAVVATATTGTLVYQWQRRASATGRWTNVSATLDGSVYSDFNTDTLVISDVTGLDGYEYRVKLTSSAGAEEVISDAASLTVTAAP